MGERLLCKQEVDGSIPFTSTKLGIGVAAGLGAAGSSTAGSSTAGRFHTALVGEFELGPSSRLGSARSRIPGRGGRNWGPSRTVSRSSYRTPVLDASSRCWSLWIGLLDEGLKWTPSPGTQRVRVRRRRLMARLLSGLDEHVCPLRCGACPCA